MADIEDVETRVPLKTENRQSTQVNNQFQLLPVMHQPAWSLRSLLPWNWLPTSQFSVAYAESVLLNRVVDCDLEAKFVPIGNGAELRSIRCTKPQAANDAEYQQREPLLLLHGMGAGIGLWCKNLSSLAQHRQVYAIDLLGFGRSSRVAFPSNPAACESQFVQSIEQWRRAEGLDSFLLLGHSFGGYLACSYSLTHPAHVRKLILADPWGMLPRANEPPRGRRMINFIGNVMHKFDPLDIVRATGPLGPAFIRRFRSDIQAHFEDPELPDTATASADGSIPTSEASGRSSDALDYIYHCNAQPASGETGFRYLSAPLGFAQRPMLARLEQLDERLPVSLLYGTNSWIFRFGRPQDAPPIGVEFRQHLGQQRQFAVHAMDDCGHHVYAENAQLFNWLVNQECKGF